MRNNIYENWGRVLHHDNGGISFVEITDETGLLLAMPHFRMLTECIPLELRPIGSRFLFQWEGIWPEESDSVEELRDRCRKSCRILRSAKD